MEEVQVAKSDYSTTVSPAIRLIDDEVCGSSTRNYLRAGECVCAPGGGADTAQDARVSACAERS
jgi:hypothetical protein